MELTDQEIKTLQLACRRLSSWRITRFIYVPLLPLIAGAISILVYFLYQFDGLRAEVHLVELDDTFK